MRKLSAGQRRRLALARLIAAPRTLWLLDEPLTPLDAEPRTLFGTVLAEHLAGGGLILAAVHDPLPITARAVEIGRVSIRGADSQLSALRGAGFYRIRMMALWPFPLLRGEGSGMGVQTVRKGSSRGLPRGASRG